MNEGKTHEERAQKAKNAIYWVMGAFFVLTALLCYWAKALRFE